MHSVTNPPDVSDDADDETTGTCTSKTHETPENEQVNPVRRSSRTRDQPNRLQYAELGSPILAMMQSFFRGLTTVLDTAESGSSVGSSFLTPQVVTAQPLPCHGTGMRSMGESVAQAS